MQHIANSYPNQVAVLKTVDASTMTALGNNPNDIAAQSRALSQLTGVSAAAVGAVIAHGPAVEAAGEQLKSISIDRSGQGPQVPRRPRAPTRADLEEVSGPDQDPPEGGRLHAEGSRQDPKDVDAQTSAIAQLTGLPRGTVRQVVVHGPSVQTSGDRLKSAASRCQPRTCATSPLTAARWKPPAAESPRQWQRWWWICFAGQLLLIPFIFALSGRWNPRKARRRSPRARAARRRANSLRSGEPAPGGPP